jgi:hypothetical protein
MRHEVEPRQTRDGASLNLSFSGPLAERPFFANSYLGFQRWFSYADDDIVPEAFGASDGKAVLTNFKEKSVLPKIPSLRIIGTAGTDSGTGQWWAGSDRPVLGATVSADEAIAALRERSDDFSAAIKNECIGGFITLAPYNSSNVGGLMPTQVHSTYFNLQTHKSNAEVARTWIWTRDESPLLGTVWNSQLPTEQAVNAPACAPGGVKPPVVHDAQAHIDLATRFPWNPSKRADGFFVSTQPGEALIGEDSPWLQVAFRTSFAAEGESQGLRSVALEASAVGLWLAIGGEPAELAELEGEYGWPASAGFAAA